LMASRAHSCSSAFAGEMALRYTDERPMAGGGVKRLDDATAEVKRLYVLPRGARARCRPPPPASLSRTLPSSWAVGTFVSTPAIRGLPLVPLIVARRVVACGKVGS